MQRIIATLTLACVSLVASYAILATWPDQPGSVQTVADKAAPIETPAAIALRVGLAH